MIDRSQPISEVGGVVTDGGLSVPPANTVADRAHTKAPAASKRLSMVLSPSFENGRQTHGATLILTANQRPSSVRFQRLLESDPAEALTYADGMLSVAACPAEYVTWSNNTALAQRYLYDFRGSRRTHVLAAPTVATLDDPRLVGLHYHGKGFTHLELGEWDAALADLREARKVFASAAMWEMVASCDNNTGLLYVRANLPGEARQFIERAVSRWLSLGMDAMAARGLDTRARAEAAVKDYASALRTCADSIEMMKRAGDERGVEDCRRTLAEINEGLGL
jgi:tetratricopeptide (TPR) repeat protein